MFNSIWMELKNRVKRFHFRELDWLIYFPESGNRGKYLGYTVIFRDRRRNPTQEQRITLGELFSKSEFEECFPHTVGFFKRYSGEGADFKPDYMEIRIMRSLEDFWLFLNALNI